MATNWEDGVIGLFRDLNCDVGTSSPKPLHELSDIEAARFRYDVMRRLTEEFGPPSINIVSPGEFAAIHLGWALSVWAR